MSHDPASIELTGGARDVAIETTLPGEGDGLAPDEEAPDPLHRGSTIGRYTVLERIGSGGMGVVYAAFDPHLDRRVALKIMHPSTRSRPSDSRARLRLLSEAQAIAKLSHPNVIAVHDVGTFGDRVFVAMDFIEGCSLREWMRSEHDWSEVVEAFVRAGRGLAAAHAADLVHRDFKPDNVLMGNDGRVLVMDFGLARPAALRTTNSETSQSSSTMMSALQPAARDGEPENLSITRTGALLGTPAYMSPEQHKGVPLGPAADQFSFCVALYEGLYGERPFAGNNLASLAINVLDGNIRVPPRDSKVPSWLRQVVLRGLRVDPEERHPSMDALLADLQQDPPNATNPWIVALVAATVAAGVVGIYFATRPRMDEVCGHGEHGAASQWNEDRKATLRKVVLDVGAPYGEPSWQTVASRLDAYVDAWTTTYSEQCRSDPRVRSGAIEPAHSAPLVCLEDGLIELDVLLSALAQADAAVVRHAVEAVQALAPPERCGRPDHLASVAARVEGSVAQQARFATLTRDLAHARILTIFERSDEAVKRLIALSTTAHKLEHPGASAEVYLQLSRAQAQLGDLATAEQALREAILAASTAERPDLEAWAWAGMVDVVALRGRNYDQGPRLALAAEAAIGRAGDDPLLRADLAMTRGRIEEAIGNYENALVHFKGALALRLEHLPPDDLALADARLGIGAALEGLSRFPVAVEEHKGALALLEQRLGAQHPGVGHALLRVGTATQAMGSLDLAEASLVRARMLLDPLGKVTVAEPATEVTGLDPADVRPLALVLDALGLVARSKQQFEEAVELHTRAAALAESDERDRAYALQNLGVALSDRGRDAAAVTELRRSLELWSATLPEDHPDIGIASLNLGSALLGVGRIEEAHERFQQALDIWGGLVADDHPLLAYALTGLGRTHMALGDGATAIGMLEQALRIRDRDGEDPFNIAETSLLLARALWAANRDPERSFALVIRARELVNATVPRDAAGLQRVLEGESVPKFTDVLGPARLGVTNLTGP